MFTAIIPGTVSPDNRDLAAAYAAAAADDPVQQAAVGLLLRLPGELFAHAELLDRYTVRTFDDDQDGDQPPIAVSVLWATLAAATRNNTLPRLSDQSRALLIAACSIAGPVPVAFRDIAGHLDDAAIDLLVQAVHHAVKYRPDGETFDAAMTRVPNLVDTTGQKAS